MVQAADQMAMVTGRVHCSLVYSSVAVEEIVPPALVGASYTTRAGHGEAEE